MINKTKNNIKVQSIGGNLDFLDLKNIICGLLIFALIFGLSGGVSAAVKQKECEIDSDCASDEYCDNYGHVCKKNIASPNPCPDGQHLEHSICVQDNICVQDSKTHWVPIIILTLILIIIAFLAGKRAGRGKN